MEDEGDDDAQTKSPKKKLPTAKLPKSHGSTPTKGKKSPPKQYAAYGSGPKSLVKKHAQASLNFDNLPPPVNGPKKTAEPASTTSKSKTTRGATAAATAAATVAAIPATKQKP